MSRKCKSTGLGRGFSYQNAIDSVFETSVDLVFETLISYLGSSIAFNLQLFEMKNNGSPVTFFRLSCYYSDNKVRAQLVSLFYMCFKCIIS